MRSAGRVTSIHPVWSAMSPASFSWMRVLGSIVTPLIVDTSMNLGRAAITSSDFPKNSLPHLLTSESPRVQGRGGLSSPLGQPPAGLARLEGARRAARREGRQVLPGVVLPAAGQTSEGQRTVFGRALFRSSSWVAAKLGGSHAKRMETSSGCRYLAVPSVLFSAALVALPHPLRLPPVGLCS